MWAIIVRVACSPALALCMASVSWSMVPTVSARPTPSPAVRKPPQPGPCPGGSWAGMGCVGWDSGAAPAPGPSGSSARREPIRTRCAWRTMRARAPCRATNRGGRRARPLRSRSRRRRPPWRPCSCASMAANRTQAPQRSMACAHWRANGSGWPRLAGRVRQRRASGGWRQRDAGLRGSAPRGGGGGRRHRPRASAGSPRSAQGGHTAMAPRTVYALGPSRSGQPPATPRGRGGAPSGGGARAPRRAEPHGGRLLPPRGARRRARPLRPTPSRRMQRRRTGCAMLARRAAGSSTTSQGGPCSHRGGAGPRPWRTGTPHASGMGRRTKGAAARALGPWRRRLRTGAHGRARGPRGHARARGRGGGAPGATRPCRWPMGRAAGAVAGPAGAVPGARRDAPAPHGPGDGELGPRAVGGGSGGRRAPRHPRPGTRVPPAPRARTPPARPPAPRGTARPGRPPMAVGPRRAQSAPSALHPRGCMALSPPPGSGLSEAGQASSCHDAPSTLPETTSSLTRRTRT